MKMIKKVPISELNHRMEAFRGRMQAVNPNWRLAVIISKINSII